MQRCELLKNFLKTPSLSSFVGVILRDGATVEEVRDPINAIIQRLLDHMGQFTDRLIRGEIAVC